MQRERDELAEANNSLQKTVADLEQEIQRSVGGYCVMWGYCDLIEPTVLANMRYQISAVARIYVATLNADN